MVNMRELWEPIVLSSVLAFGASSLIWMALGYHKTDMTGLPDEESARQLLRKQNLAPGQYVVPWHADMKEMQKPEFKQKMADGPLAMITIRPLGAASMGKALAQWFFYLFILNSIFAFITGRMMSHGVPYPTVFAAVGGIAWLGYGGAVPVMSIFWGRPWRVTLKDMFDTLVYASLAAGTFGWLWPR